MMPLTLTRPILSSMARSTRSSSRRNLSKKLPPPLPADKSKPLSPAQAKQQYLESKKNVEDPIAKMNRLQQELHDVRETAAATLDKELNKSVWRKLTDPMMRYKHSMINVGAVTLAYILAHNLFVTSKANKEARSELLEANQQVASLQQVLQKLLKEENVQDLADKIAQELQQEEQASKKSSRWSSRSILSSSKSTTTIANTIQDYFKTHIGAQAYTNDQKEAQQVEQAWKDNQAQIRQLHEHPEEVLMQALQEAEEHDSQTNKKSRRVFSM